MFQAIRMAPENPKLKRGKPRESINLLADFEAVWKGSGEQVLRHPWMKTQEPTSWNISKNI